MTNSERMFAADYGCSPQEYMRRAMTIAVESKDDEITAFLLWALQQEVLRKPKDTVH
jgi:hypothetical protein